jgi:hypothetical protein
MPTLSASDYTKYIKYQAAQQAYQNGAVPRAIQTTDQLAPTVSVVNSYLKTSQAAYVINASKTNLTGLNYVRGVQPSKSNNPNALSTLSYGGGLGSSAIQRPGGLPGPARSSVSTYTRLPQSAGWS